MYPDRFGEDWHGEDVEVGLAPPAHVHVHVLAGVVAAQHRQRVVGADDELEKEKMTKKLRNLQKIFNEQIKINKCTLT